MPHFILVIVIGLALLSTQSNASSLEQATLAFQQGKFEQAIKHWQTALDTEQLPPTRRFDTFINLAMAYQGLGLSDKAQQKLNLAENLTLHVLKTDKIRQARLFTVLSDLALATRQAIQARKYADKSIALLPTNASTPTRAVVLNNLGNVLTVEAYYDKAIQTYTESITLAKKANAPKLIIRALINQAHAHFKQAQIQSATVVLDEAQRLLEPTATDYKKVFDLISIGELAQRIQQSMAQKRRGKTRKTLRRIALQTLQLALNLAQKLAHPRLISYASGYLGQLYESEHRYTEALPLTRQAIFFAQQIEAMELLYRWQWQLGRLFKAQQQHDRAIIAYQEAIENLQPIRQALMMGYRYTSQPFRETTGPVFFELTDLLLQKAESTGEKSYWLKAARDTVESFKAVELQNYFQDDCVVKSRSTLATASTDIPHTAIIYPILLPDRTEILLSLPKYIQQFTIPVNIVHLREVVNEFRFEIESHDSEAYLLQAQRLYRWLIEPLEETLTAQKITTLIIVPDDVLRTIPFATLHNGQQFLVSKYTFVMLPGLSLTNTQPTHWHDPKILISGLSVAVQNYPALEQVQKEIHTVKNFYPQQATVLLNESFTVAAFAEQLENTIYDIIHVASHGQFSNSAQNTFLLTYDGQLAMYQLEQLIRLSKLRNRPVELLTLSACRTAVGDDQAALGLAGVAIKAGAKATLASLWSVEDKATTLLIGEFYRQLQHKRIAKAKALQKAQQFLLDQTRYQHPVFWAPFLLIGNWY